MFHVKHSVVGARLGVSRETFRKFYRIVKKPRAIDKARGFLYNINRNPCGGNT